MNKDIFNFNPPKPKRCKHCRHYKLNHKADTFECPMGTKGRIGYTMYGPTVYEVKDEQNHRS